MKTIKDLVKHLCEHEGLKSEVSVGDMREIVGLISDVIHEQGTLGNAAIFIAINNNGARRAKKRKAAK